MISSGKNHKVLALYGRLTWKQKISLNAIDRPNTLWKKKKNVNSIFFGVLPKGCGFSVF